MMYQPRIHPWSAARPLPTTTALGLPGARSPPRLGRVSGIGLRVPRSGCSSQDDGVGTAVTHQRATGTRAEATFKVIQ